MTNVVHVIPQRNKYPQYYALLGLPARYRYPSAARWAGASWHRVNATSILRSRLRRAPHARVVNIQCLPQNRVHDAGELAKLSRLERQSLVLQQACSAVFLASTTINAHSRTVELGRMGFTQQDINNLRASLQDAVVKCSERCLYQAAKWY